MIEGGTEILADLAGSIESGTRFRRQCMEAISKLQGYDWCGVYRLEGDTLVLDAYVGDATDHDRIPVGKGVCGTAVATGKNQIVDDVNSLDNYLSCSLATKSEIVVLIRTQRTPHNPEPRILGQIDIDSHQIGRFARNDELFLEVLSVLLADRWE